jgi:2-polyprenyl-3-methyl-5-hydroxy-6-metoxy-1,4-benzoquinol methylase
MTALPLRARLGRGSNRLAKPFRKLLNVAELLQESIPVGIMRASDIDAAVQRAYADAPDFYDPSAYRIDYETDLVEPLKALTTGRRLLDLYCGQGREARIFAEAGFEVLGVDALASSVEGAKRYAAAEGFDASFVAADIDDWTPDAQWDVVYTSLWMYSTIPDRAARLHWLKRFTAWLKPGGVLVISTTPNNSPTAAARRYKVARAVALLTLNSRRPELGDRFYRSLFWHDFTPDEIRAELEELDLDVVQELHRAPPTPCDMFLLQHRA